jgi:hypothetical protein
MAKPKKINFELISEIENDTQPEPYRILEEIRDANHRDIASARIALAWRKNEKADQDGHLVLGRCVKVSDLYKQFADYDFIIVLNREVWNDIEFTNAKKLALMDHELCHAAAAYDEETGERKMDERGRQVFRSRKHDIEEFEEVVTRHGCYKRDLERFAEALIQRRNNPLFKDDETTVQIGLHRADGTIEYSEPVSTQVFSKMANRLSKQ